MLSLADIQYMTLEYGEAWGYPHVQRVLKLSEVISREICHDREVLMWAIYLHDWGAFPKYRQNGVAHALCSKQVTETEILPHTVFSNEQKCNLLEAIEKHDYQDTRPLDCPEALILREADYLDMLGTIGIVREFAWGPNSLQVCYDRILKHRDNIQHRLQLPLARQIANQRLDRMNQILQDLLDESFGFL